MKAIHIVYLLSSTLLASPAFASADFYLGVGVGMSNLTPEINLQEADSEQELAGTLFLGKEFGDNFALEGSYSYLNDFNVSATGGDIEYQTYGVSGIVYWPLSSSDWSVYGKAGANYLDAEYNASSFDVEHKISLATGLGIRWNMSENWFARVEYNVYDSDYSAAFIQVARAWGSTSADTTEVVEAQPEQLTIEVVEEVVEPIETKTFEAQSFTYKGFESGSAELTESINSDLSGVVTVLKETPNASVEIVGHTDSTGSEEFNQALSLERANSVALAIENEGIQANRIVTLGEGETKPVASNATSEGRAENRRVDVTIPQFDYSVSE